MRNPNAVVGGTSGIGGGALVVFLLSLVHVSISAYAGVAIAGAIATAVLWVGRLTRDGGLIGVWNRLLHGDPPPKPPTV